MVFANYSGNLAAARDGLNRSADSLRTWHERLLFGSSTQQLASGAVQYQAHDALPVYRSTPVVEQVRRCHCSEYPCLVDPLIKLQPAPAGQTVKSFLLDLCKAPFGSHNTFMTEDHNQSFASSTSKFVGTHKV